jgi:hypothetical protein
MDDRKPMAMTNATNQLDFNGHYGRPQFTFVEGVDPCPMIFMERRFLCGYWTTVHTLHKRKLWKF